MIVGYYGSWATYRPGNGEFHVENIDPNLCTHLIYAFAGLDETTNQIRSLDPYNDLEENYGKGAYKRFNALKNRNPNLKSLIAIGGWNESPAKYSTMAANEGSRRQFASSCVSFIKKYGFDGLDVDWEYPGAANRGGRPEDKTNFILLLKELRQQFNQYGLLLTVAVSAGKSTIDKAYDVPNMVQYVDFINIMAYDYHGSWESRTGHNSPMNASPHDIGDNRYLNVNYSINYWLQLGAPPRKLNLGMGSYGRSFTLSDPGHHGLNQPSTGAGTAGPYTKEAGNLGYNEICETQDSWNIVWDDSCSAPYAYKGNQWVGYDNPKSIEIKCRFAKSKNLGGVMMWSIETDDFRGISGTTFPLLRTMNSNIR